VGIWSVPSSSFAAISKFSKVDDIMIGDDNLLPAPRATRWGMLRAAPFEGDAQLPEAVDVAIIGGGILGVTLAWQLARAGRSVAVFEKRRSAARRQVVHLDGFRTACRICQTGNVPAREGAVA